MIKEKAKKILKNIDMIILIIILLSSTVFIRSTVQFYNNDNNYKLQIEINVIAIIFIIIGIIKKKPIKLIQSKLDIGVLLLSISSIIPVVFNTYISLTTTVMSILNCETMFLLYILTREICKKDKKRIHILINFVIIITVILIAIGIENLTTNKIMPFIGITNITNGEDRLVSLFGNPNTLASMITMAFFLSLNESLLTNSNKKKALYNICNSIFIIGILLTYSKTIFIIFPLLLIFYMISIKDKQKNIYILQNIFTSLLIGTLYIYIFQLLIKQELYLYVLLLSLYTIVILVIINILNEKINRYLTKIKLKTFIIITTIIVVIIAIWLVIQLNNGKEYIVFNKNTNTNYAAKIISNIKPNEKYILGFDMNAVSSYESENNDSFTINIIQRDVRNKEITSTEESFNKFNGLKEIEIETTNDTYEIKIEFKSKSKYMQKELIINKFFLNGDEYILEYKYLPTKAVEKIKNINFKYKTAQERMEFIKDGFKLIKENPITGIGGGGWQFKYGEVQDYNYTSIDLHSYPTKIWLEFGIVGIVGLIVVYIVVIFFKDKEKVYTGIKFALLVALLHCITDSDMEFMYFEIVSFMLLGTLSIKNSKEEIKNKKAIYIANASIIVVSIITIVLNINPKIYNKKIAISELEKELKKDSIQLINAYENALKYERDKSTEFEYKYRLFLLKLDTDSLEEAANEYYEFLLNYKNTWRNNPEKVIEKSDVIVSILGKIKEKNNPKLNEISYKLAKINIDEFEECQNQLIKIADKEHINVKEDIMYVTLLENYSYSIQIYNEFEVKDDEPELFGVKLINTSDIDIEEKIKDCNPKIKNKKDILIYHSHTTEAYNDEYEETEFRKTLNSSYNVIAVGETLKEELEARGYNVIHLEDYNDSQGIDRAYTVSNENLKKFLENYGKKIDIIIDLHRDSYGNANLGKSDPAKIMFVVGVRYEGWEDGLKLAIKTQKEADKKYPNLFKPITILDKMLNQELANNALLIEVGEENNSLEKAKESVKYFADVFDIAIKESN